MSIDTVNTGITPDRWTRMSAGHLPCASCGIAVPSPVDNFDGEDVELLQIFGEPGSHPTHATPRLDFAVTRCETCSMIRASARALIAGHPEVRARIGAFEIGVHRLECALSALDALGITDPATIDRLTATRADIIRLMDALTIPGGAVRWTFFVQGARFGRAASTPASGPRWSHVSEEKRQELRNAAGALLAHRIEKQVNVLAPSDDGSPSGCMLCGVAAVPAFREQLWDVWTLMSADAVTIGGRPQADTLDGVVCPRCDRAIDEAHGVGRSAMTISVRSFLGLPSYLRSLDRRDGLKAWAVLPKGTPPNAEPWGHMDLTEAREEASALATGATPRAAARPAQRQIYARPDATSPQMIDA